MRLNRYFALLPAAGLCALALLLTDATPESAAGSSRAGTYVGQLEGMIDLIGIRVTQADAQNRRVPAQARLLLGLQKLAAAAGTQPHVKFRAVYELKNLNAVVMIQRDATHDDIEVEDEVSSLFLIGPPETTKVTIFNRQDFSNADGQLTVETGGAGIVVIRDLHTAGDPVSETGGTVTRERPSTKPDGFGQAISSLRFFRAASTVPPNFQGPRSKAAHAVKDLV